MLPKLVLCPVINYGGNFLDKATLVFKSSSRPGAPGMPTGESDSTFRASRPTSWRLDSSSLTSHRLGALCSPGQPKAH
jgi:hypothetical protein